jgi:hypothetical protein
MPSGRCRSLFVRSYIRRTPFLLVTRSGGGGESNPPSRLHAIPGFEDRRVVAMCDDIKLQVPPEVLCHRIQAAAALNHSGRVPLVVLGCPAFVPRANAKRCETMGNAAHSKSLVRRHFRGSPQVSGLGVRALTRRMWKVRRLQRPQKCRSQDEFRQGEDQGEACPAFVPYKPSKRRHILLPSPPRKRQRDCHVNERSTSRRD